MSSAVWDSDPLLRRDALWKDADHVLTTRAMARCGLVVSWIALAVSTVDGFAWVYGLPMLATAALSLLHAHHVLVVRIEERLPGLPRRVLERLFVYPDEPHVNWIGTSEMIGLVSLAMATGWPGHVLAADPPAAAVGSAIVVGVVGSFVANVSGHVVWEIEPGPRWMRRVRMILGPFGALSSFALLWWASPVPAARFVAVAGPLLVIGGSWRLIVQIARQVQDFDESRRHAAESIHRIDSMMVHSTLKNPSRPIIDDLELIPDSELRDRVRRLCYSIGGFTQTLRRGDTYEVFNAEHALQAVLSFDPEWADRYRDSITHDLEAGDLSPRDSRIVFIAVSDLVTNAAQRSATQLEVELTSAAAEHGGSTLTVRVLCRCGRPIGTIAPTSSLMRLATLLYGVNGTMRISDAGDGSHVFTLTWPSLDRPRARTTGTGSRSTDDV